MSKERRKLSPCDKKDDLSLEFLLELRRRIADSKNPVRYAVFSNVAGDFGDVVSEMSF